MQVGSHALKLMSLRQVAASLVAVVAVLALDLRAAEATPCKGPGESCRTNQSCCSGHCVGAVPKGSRPGFGKCGGAANGQPCTTGSQCTSTFCVDGFCCDMACDGLCQACSAAKTGGVDGTCTFVPAGSDPDDECTDEGVCGQNGECDGAGACQLYAAGTPCNDGMFCNGRDTCDGVGNCSLHSGNPCSPTTCHACGAPNFCTTCQESSDSCTGEGSCDPGCPCP